MIDNVHQGLSYGVEVFLFVKTIRAGVAQDHLGRLGLWKRRQKLVLDDDGGRRKIIRE